MRTRTKRLEGEEPFDHAIQAYHRVDAAYRVAAMGGQSMEEILRQEQEREKDGFPKRLRWAKYVYPAPDGKRVIVLPHVTSDRIVHGRNPVDGGEGNGSPLAGPLPESGGAGKGDVGDVIGRSHENDGDDGSAGNETGEHGILDEPERIGKMLTEHFRLPNLNDKIKSRSFTQWQYELTDANRRSGQRLDMQRSIAEIIRTNLAIGRIEDITNIDTANLIVGPDDLWYRTLSREPDAEPQALVFFVRDYSGSMSRERTDLVVSQHLLLYCWLMYQYKGNVETRFVVHDTQAKEVPDFPTYHRSSSGGGTSVASAYTRVRDTMDEERLDSQYNVFLFHGTDGDDVPSSAKQTANLLEELAPRMSRIGITITNPERTEATVLELALGMSGIAEKYRGKIVTTVLRQSSDEHVIKSLREVLA